MLDVVTGDDEWARLARVIEDFGLLRGEEPRGERFCVTRFFSTDRSRRGITSKIRG
jgi:hypothetical protein